VTRPDARGVALLTALLVPGCGAACSSRPPTAEDYLVVGVASSPNNLDPRLGSDAASQQVHQLVFNSLLTLDEQLNVVPDLATGWSTPNDRTYRVALRHGVRFHDGRELTAEDVVYTFSSFLDPDFISPRKGAYRLLTRVAAIDRYTVEFVLEEPFGSFPVNLVMGIVPAGSGPELGRAPIGTGPYRVVQFTPDDRTTLARFDDYFGAPASNPGLVLRVVPDDTMRGLELRKGTVDVVINDLAPDVVDQLERDERLQVAQAPGIDYAYIGLNLRDPILSDQRVRQALAYAIDRDAIVGHLRRGQARPAVGILSPVSWAFTSDVDTFDHDPDQARRLLDDAGYPDPDGDGPATRFALTLRTSTAEFFRLQAAVIQQDLRRIGVALVVRSTEFATLYADVLRGNFQMYSLQWVGVSDPDMLRRVFHSDQMPPNGFNRGFYSNPTVDALIDRATRSTDLDERRGLYADVQAIVARDVPYLSLWYKTNVVVAQADLEGIAIVPNADFSLLARVHR
jgi:peptide/nickel transport system substrate-binding protein